MPEPRTPLVAANWKMHKTRTEAGEFLDGFLPNAAGLGDTDVAICPPFTALDRVIEGCEGSSILVAAQNVHFSEEGAFTGEVAPRMLSDVGAWGAIVGHSERRHIFGESDEVIGRKVPALFNASLVPILCVGETEEERDAGRTEEVLRRQLEADLAEVPRGLVPEVVVAYEPVWAIGTGRTATTEQAGEAIAFARSVVGDIDPGAADAVRILYGGSVKPQNAAELMGVEGIDGALVGGASLDPSAFLEICKGAGQ